MNNRDGRVEFARQLHNLLHLGVEDDEARETQAETSLLDYRIQSVEELKSFHTKNDTGSGGGGGQGTANSAELGAHGYEVGSQVIVDDGGTWEPLFKVWRPLSTYYTPL